MQPSEVLSRPETKRMDPSAQMAVVATREAWADAGSPEVDPERLGAVVSSGIGGVWTLLSAWDTMKEKGASRVLPMTVPMLMPNSPAAYVSLEAHRSCGRSRPRVRLRVRRGGHRDGLRDDPAGPCRRGRLRRNRGGDSPAAHLVVRRDGGAVEAQ
ncbi:hypothetical protein GCM10025876_03300 [Demequina litorisediminis]|uniref:Beta-ketoacyl synthase-like N-terminal domain-containing protein n=1 Tax=Demequina litorisediminis TaxID=1849022 RepID=A0ABQ6IA52_9MICO|nr:hypothetical protein GCM10025876_03300 [Demequina litorisediminis]